MIAYQMLNPTLPLKQRVELAKQNSQYLPVIDVDEVCEEDPAFYRRIELEITDSAKATIKARTVTFWKDKCHAMSPAFENVVSRAVDAELREIDARQVAYTQMQNGTWTGDNRFDQVTFKRDVETRSFAVTLSDCVMAANRALFIEQARVQMTIYDKLMPSEALVVPEEFFGRTDFTREEIDGFLVSYETTAFSIMYGMGSTAISQNELVLESQKMLMIAVMYQTWKEVFARSREADALQQREDAGEVPTNPARQQAFREQFSAAVG